MDNGQQSAAPAALRNNESYLARIDNTMAALQEQNLTGDPRYAQLAALRQRLAGKEQ